MISKYYPITNSLSHTYINILIGINVADAPTMKHNPAHIWSVAGYVPLYMAVPNIPPIDCMHPIAPNNLPV